MSVQHDDKASSRTAHTVAAELGKQCIEGGIGAVLLAPQNKCKVLQVAGHVGNGDDARHQRAGNRITGRSGSGLCVSAP